MRRRPSRSCSIIRSPQQGTTTSTHDMRKGDVVYKVGASTRCTIGQFSGIKPSCVIKEERYMLERKREKSDTVRVDIKSTEFMFIRVEEVPLARWATLDLLSGTGMDVRWDYCLEDNLPTNLKDGSHM